MDKTPPQSVLDSILLSTLNLLPTLHAVLAQPHPPRKTNIKVLESKLPRDSVNTHLRWTVIFPGSSTPD